MPAIVSTTLIFGLICVGGSVEHVEDSVPTENTYVQKFTIDPSSGWWCDDTFKNRISRHCKPRQKSISISEGEIIFDDINKKGNGTVYSLNLKSGILSAYIAVGPDYTPPGPQKSACNMVPLDGVRGGRSLER